LAIAILATLAWSIFLGGMLVRIARQLVHWSRPRRELSPPVPPHARPGCARWGNHRAARPLLHGCCRPPVT